MNKELILKTAEEIESKSEEFDMNVFDTGKKCCIAGRVCRIAGVNLKDSAYARWLFKPTLSALLDIPPDRCMVLFEVSDWPKAYLDEYCSSSDSSRKASAAASLLRGIASEEIVLTDEDVNRQKSRYRSAQFQMQCSFTHQ